MKLRYFRILLTALLLIVSFGVFIPINGVLATTLDYQVTASADDIGVYWNGSAWATDGTGSAAQYVGYVSSGVNKFGAGIRFTGVTIPAGATITSAYISIEAVGNYSLTTVNSYITGDKENNPATFSTLADYQARRGTVVGGANNNYNTVQVAWNSIGSWTTDTWYNSPDISTIIQELVNAHAPTNEAIALFWDDHNGGSTATANTYRRSYTFEQTGHVSGAKLHIEYKLPPVTTQGAGSVTNTTALGNGNITDLGGAASCSQEGFDWGTTTLTYPNSVTQSGTYGTGAFTETITGLPQGTLIYYRAKALNSVGWGYGAEATFLTLPDAPTSFVANPGDTANALSWVVGTGATGTIVRGTIGSYPTGYANGTSIYSGTGTSVNHTGLTNGDHWYYRAWSYTTVGGTTTYSTTYAQADATPASGLPSVTTGAATSPTSSSIVLNGTIVSVGSYTASTYVYFQYGTTSSYGTDTAHQVETAAVGFNQIVNGLTSNTLYHVRAVLCYDTAYHVYGADVTFTTSSLGPVLVSTGTSINVTTSEATIQGTLVSMGDYSGTTVYAYFEYGTTISYGYTTTLQGLTAPSSFAATLTGLTSGTTYYYNARISYGSSMAVGTGSSFATSTLGVPTATTVSAVGVGITTATLQGSIALNGYSGAIVYFEYGTTVGFGTSTAQQTMSTSGSFNQSITGLTASTTYYFRADAVYGSPSTTVNGSTLNFTTGAVGTPTITTNAAADITSTTATLQGTADIGTQTLIVVWFEWGSTTSYGSSTAAQNLVASQVFNAPLTGLLNNVTYYYRADLQYGTTTIYGVQLSFVASVAASTLVPNPDNPGPAIVLWNAYENTYVSGDILILVEYNIPYAIAPANSASVNFAIRYANAAGTVLQNVVPFAYNDLGYGYGAAAFYWSPTGSGPAWGDLGTIQLIGNPTISWSSGIPSTTVSMTSANWNVSTSTVVGRTQVCQEVIIVANSLKNRWGTDLTSLSSNGTVLNSYGQQYFSGIVPYFSTICGTIMVVSGAQPVQPMPTNGSAANGSTGVITGSPVVLLLGTNTIVITHTGDFTVTLPSDYTGSALSGSAALTVSPATLGAGINTLTATNIGTVTIIQNAYNPTYAQSLADTWPNATTTLPDGTVGGVGVSIKNAASSMGMTPDQLIFMYFLSIMAVVMSITAAVLGGAQFIPLLFIPIFVGGMRIGVVPMALGVGLTAILFIISMFLLIHRRASV